MIVRAFFAAVLALCLGLPAFSFAADSVKLTYSNFFPPTHVQSQLAEAWAKEVEKRTDGAVQVDYFPGGTLTSAKQCYDGVVQGISDVGMSVLAYSRGRFPVMAAVDLPLGYRSGMAATKAANAVYAKFQPKEFNDVEAMYFHAHGPGLVFTKDTPVKTMAGMKGLKLRATGNSAKVVAALGGTPVAMSMPESYQSIQKGVVDGGVYPMETNKGWKMAEVVDYGTLNYSSAYTTTFFVVMNSAKWAKIPPEAQKIIREINEEWIVKHGQAWDESDEEGRAFFLEQGNELIEQSDAEAARWKEAVQPIIQGYVDEADTKGIDGQAVVETITEMLQ